MNISSEPKTKAETFVFLLFVAGDEPNSKIARANLRKICESHIKDRCKIEVVDVFGSFDIALENNILLSPALIKVAPLPRITIYRNLSNTREVLTALRLAGDE